MKSTIPQNHSAELAAISILSQIETATTAFAWAENLFLNPACKILFRHILEARRAGQSADRISLSARLEASGELKQVGGMPGLEEILRTYPLSPRAAHSHVAPFHERLVDAATRRAVLAVLEDSDNDLRSSSIEVDAFMENLAVAARPAESRKTTSRGEQLTALLDEIEGKTDQEFFHSGLPEVDRKLYGGVQRGEMFTVLGPTGGGKSIVLAQAALACAQDGKQVAFFSLEMPATAVWKRIAANAANCPLPRAGQIVNAGTLNKLGAAIRAASKLPLTIFDSMLTMTDIEVEARRLAKQGKADVVIVDYIQRVRNVGKFPCREQAVADIATRLKSLTMESRCAVLTASQLNKEGDARESAAIEHDSDILFRIKEDGFYCQKFRRGPDNWTVPAVMRGELGRFEEERRK